MCRIFHVDEDAVDLVLSRKQLEQTLPDLDHRAFNTSQELLDAVEAGEKCDCILSGYSMSDLDGISLFKRVSNAGLDVPFIILTEEEDERIVEEAFAAGVTDFFLKAEKHILWRRLAASITSHVESHHRKITLEKSSRELAAQRDILQTVIENAPLHISFKDGKNRWMELNKMAREFWGLSREDYYGKTASEIAKKFPHQKKAFERSVISDEAVWAKRDTIVKNVSMKGSDGVLQTFEVFKKPTFHKDGSRIGLTMIASNLTSKIQLEEALKESEAYYRAIFDNSPVGLFVLEKEGTLLRVNSGVEQILDREVEDLIGSNILDYSSEESLEHDSKVFKKLVEQGKIEHDSHLYDQAGRKKYFSSVINKIDIPGESQVFLGSLIDTTAVVEAKIHSNVLNQLMLDLNRVSTLDEMAKLCLRAATQVSQCSVGAFLIMIPGANKLKIVSSLGISEKSLEKLAQIDQNSLNLQTVYQGHALFTNYNKTESARIDRFPGEEWKALAVLPCVSNGEVLGSFFVTSRTREDFNTEVKTRLQSIAIQVGKVINELLTRSQILEQKEQLDLAIASAGFNLWDMDLPEKRIRYRRLSFAVTDVSKENEFEIIDKQIEQTVHKDDLKKTQKALADHFSGQTDIYGTEYRLKDQTGNWRWISSRGKVVEWNEDGSPKRMLGLDKDVTEEKATNMALNEKEERLKITMDVTGTGTWDWNIQTGEARFNNKWADLLGYKLEDLEPTSDDTWNSRCHPEDLIVNNALLDDYFSGKRQNFECELRFKHADGHWVWLHSTGKVVIWEDGKPLWMVGISHDITQKKVDEMELKKSQDNLRRHSLELENLNKLLEEFTYTVSHDLHAPLRHIKGFAKLIAMDVERKNVEDVDEHVTQISEAVQRLETMIDTILRLHRTTTGELNIEQVNLTEISQTIISELQSNHPHRDVEFEVDQSLVVNADAKLLDVVLSNLLGNAWKYTSKTESARIEFRATEKEGKPVFVVADNGPGFKSLHPEEVFLPFKRMHSSDEYEGTGIGLATVSRIIKRHQGDIWVETEPGVGTSFYFTLDK